jgi:hypothetical protein
MLIRFSPADRELPTDCSATAARLGLEAYITKAARTGATKGLKGLVEAARLTCNPPIRDSI